MAKIKVHLLNYHSVFSHIEILLEHTPTKGCPVYYTIDRTSKPGKVFSKNNLKPYHNDVSSTFTFEIDADPTSIITKWNTYYFESKHQSGLFYYNCADATQWFLHEFANIPNPSFLTLPISTNLLTMGIFIPSFLPTGITLPGRVMDNAKFHIKKNDYNLSLQVAIALTALAAQCMIIRIAVLYLFPEEIQLESIASLAVVGAGIFGLFNTLKKLEGAAYALRVNGP